ncbi:PUA-like domain-containing protein [Crucibulum laeve]|uniref:PUA-like domain-containing protein n=1 Tax=Crucibulum laeve TaxID=68775 RepID=A0A5C3M8E5_9AGAR|nr:PUA-like domain-containing protein [Crucibulum laeve]
MISQYEQSRQANIEKNAALLKSLGLDKPAFEPKEVLRKPKAVPPRKRKQSATVDEDDEGPAVLEEPPSKAQRIEPQDLKEGSGVRRSSRNAGKAVDYKGEILRASLVPLAYSSGVKTTENTGPLGREEGPRKHNPKTYGHIPGVAVGTWWESRQGCSVDAIHAPWVGGISGGPNGAYSVALSGGYDDDVDLGYAFTYTGSGGRDLKGTKNAPKNLRTAPQSSDQSFENTFNKMLKRSSETKKPVRVIRGFKLKSKYAPSEGYRYDGLYTVEKAWMEKGLNAKGYLVCKYAFKRLSGQAALPVRIVDEEDNQDPVTTPEATSKSR